MTKHVDKGVRLPDGNISHLSSALASGSITFWTFLISAIWGSSLSSCIKFHCVCSFHLFFNLGAFLDYMTTSAAALQQSQLGFNRLSPIVKALPLSLPGENFCWVNIVFAKRRKYSNFTTSLLLFASLWFGCWHNLQPVANENKECHHSHETNFRKVVVQKAAWDALYSTFSLPCRNPFHCLSFYCILFWSLNFYETSSCGTPNKVSRTRVCGKEHPRDPACVTWVTFWDFRHWISSQQWKSLGGCDESELESLECIRDKTVLRPLVSISKQNLLVQFAHFLKKHWQCIIMHLVACIDQMSGLWWTTWFQSINFCVQTSGFGSSSLKLLGKHHLPIWKSMFYTSLRTPLSTQRRSIQRIVPCFVWCRC